MHDEKDTGKTYSGCMHGTVGREQRDTYAVLEDSRDDQASPKEPEHDRRGKAQESSRRAQTEPVVMTMEQTVRKCLPRDSPAR